MISLFRIMLIKNGKYNSQWQLVGNLKMKETKIISCPAHQRQSLKDPIPMSDMPTETSPIKTATESVPFNPTNQTRSSETKLAIEKTYKSASTTGYRNDAVMVQIEEHQKRHTFAPSLQQAEQNYRELRRLLKKMNGSISNETKAPTVRKQKF